MNEMITIIIPIYNLEKYIEKCIESVLDQTYTNIEIILIDDGSSDKSLEICNRYSKRDKRIKILHQENKGVSSARNLGIKKARGKYIIFIDGDDYIERTMLETLYCNLINNNADISICEFLYVDEEKNKRKRVNDNEIILLNKQEFYRYLIDTKYFCGYLFNKLIRIDLIINERGITLFDEEIHVCEDLLFLASIAKNVRKVIYTTQAYYYYVQRENSTIKQLYTYKRLTNFNALKKVIEIYKNENIDVDMEFELRFLKFTSEALFLMQYLKIKDDILKKQIKEKSKEYYKKYRKNRNINKKERLKIKLEFYFPNIIGRIKFLERKRKKK